MMAIAPDDLSDPHVAYVNVYFVQHAIFASVAGNPQIPARNAANGSSSAPVGRVVAWRSGGLFPAIARGTTDQWLCP